MPGGNKNIKPEDNPKPFKKGESPNPDGRPKKFYTSMKELGFKPSEVTECIQTMMGCDVEILTQVWNDEKVTVLERIVAKVVAEALKTGDLSNIEKLFNRAWGQSKQIVEQTFKKVGKDLADDEVKYE